MLKKLNQTILKEARVLYVEDEKSLRQVVNSSLEDITKEIILAEDGLEGLEKFKEFYNEKTSQSKIDIVISDINMPKMNGLDMIEEIRNIDSEIPILLVSAYSDNSFLKQALDLNVDGFLLKPLDTRVLVSTLFKAFKPRYLNLKLEDSLKKLNEAKHLAKLGVWEYDLRSETLHWGEGVYKVFNLDENSVTPSFELFMKLTHEDDREKVASSYKKSLEDALPYEIEHRIVLENGEEKWVLEKCSTTFDDKGNPLVSTGIIQDITLKHKNEIQEKVILSQAKNASIGEMVANIAHQWRQPLAVINTTLMKLKVKSQLGSINSEELDKSSEKIVMQVEHLNNNIDTFLNYFKANKRKIKTSIEEELLKALTISKAVLDDNNIKVVYDFDKDKRSKIKLPSGELLEVLINIINNAKDALVEKEIENKIIKLGFIENKNFYTIEIEDNAGGISEEIISKIFEPYFSTKEKNGTGLGLHMSKSIINNSLEGNLTVTNSKSGAVFSILLPK